jgi:hypothetical protein
VTPSHAAAAVVLLAFLARRARWNPMFLAGAAAFVALGHSAFIDLVPDQTVGHLAGQSIMHGA